MRKKGITCILVRSVISLYEGAKTRVRVDSELSEECCHRVMKLFEHRMKVVERVSEKRP